MLCFEDWTKSKIPSEITPPVYTWIDHHRLILLCCSNGDANLRWYSWFCWHLARPSCKHSTTWGHTWVYYQYLQSRCSAKFNKLQLIKWGHVVRDFIREAKTTWNLLMLRSKTSSISEKAQVRSYFKKKILEWGLNPQKYSILGQKCKNIFLHFLVQMKTAEFASEVNQPLAPEPLAIELDLY